MRFLVPSVETVFAIHEIVIETYGGLHGIPHPELVESALHRPESYIHYSEECDLYLVTAIILHSITRNHAFADGNKRTALITMLMTYNLNSKEQLEYSLHMNQKFEELVLYVANRNPQIRTLRTKVKKLIEEFSAQ